MKKLFKLILILSFFSLNSVQTFAAEKVDYLKTDWSFKGLFGKFDRAALQRGYQVYTEVCASCHSMKYLSSNISLNGKKHKLQYKLDILFEELPYQIFQKDL